MIPWLWYLPPYDAVVWHDYCHYLWEDGGDHRKMRSGKYAGARVCVQLRRRLRKIGNFCPETWVRDTPQFPNDFPTYVCICLPSSIIPHSLHPFPPFPPSPPPHFLRARCRAPNRPPGLGTSEGRDRYRPRIRAGYSARASPPPTILPIFLFLNGQYFPLPCKS